MLTNTWSSSTSIISLVGVSAGRLSIRLYLRVAKKLKSAYRGVIIKTIPTANASVVRFPCSRKVNITTPFRVLLARTESFTHVSGQQNTYQADFSGYPVPLLHSMDLNGHALSDNPPVKFSTEELFPGVCYRYLQNEKGCSSAYTMNEEKGENKTSQQFTNGSNYWIEPLNEDESIYPMP